MSLLLRNFCRALFPTEQNFDSVAWNSQISTVSFNLPFQRVFISCFLPASQTDGPTQWFSSLPCCFSKSRGILFLPHPAGAIWSPPPLPALPDHSTRGFSWFTSTPCWPHHWIHFFFFYHFFLSLYWICYNIASVFMFFFFFLVFFLATRHVGF